MHEKLPSRQRVLTDMLPIYPQRRAQEETSSPVKVSLVFTFRLRRTTSKSIISLIADPGVASSIPAWSHTFVEIDHEIILILM